MLMDTRPPRGGGNEPWRGEPKLVRWRDPSTAYQCVIVRQGMGHLCGYVRVPRGHPLHGKHYTHSKVQRIKAHGGLNFSGRLRGRIAKRGHWFGFDCARQNDIVPAQVELLAAFPPELAEALSAPLTGPFAKVYRTIEYVRAECTALAQQLAERAQR